MKILTDQQHRKLTEAKHEAAKAKRIIAQLEKKLRRQDEIMAGFLKVSKESAQQYESRIQELEKENARMKQLISDLPPEYQEKGPFFGKIDGDWQ